MKNIKILFFANIKAVAGTNHLEMDIPDHSRISDLRIMLGEQYPNLKESLSTCLVAMNQEFMVDDSFIPDHSEIAFFPPVSGGNQPQETIVNVTTDKFDLDDLVDRITYPTTGAACIFTGMVRGITSNSDISRTEYLQYEAYIPMAEAKLNQVANEIRQRWPSIEGIVIIQRIGKLFPQTPTVVVACSAAHRDTGVFEAARYGIDRLKEIVPIWKQESGPDGQIWIEGKYHPKSGD